MELPKINKTSSVIDKWKHRGYKTKQASYGSCTNFSINVNRTGKPERSLALISSRRTTFADLV